MNSGNKIQDLGSKIMRRTLTIRLPLSLRQKVARAAKELGVTKSEFVRRALDEQLWQQSFEASRRKLVPRARAKGIYTDEYVFDLIS